MIRRRILCIGAVGLLLVWPLTALAWDPQTPTARVGTIQVDGTSFNFWLEGSPVMCSGNKTVGIVQVGVNGVTADGLKNMLSTVMAAKLSGKRIKTYASYTAGNWACSIGAVDLLD